MTQQIRQLVALLEDAGFEHAVAIRRGRDPELGEVLEADAFDVPPDATLATSLRLGTILWPVAFAAHTVLPGVFADAESPAARAQLPGDTVWYEPHRQRARTR